MGRDSAGPVARHLIALGRDPETPALAVEDAGRPNARLIEGTLATLPDAVAGHAPEGPVVLLIGEATAVRHAARVLPVAPPQLVVSSRA
jgi:uroporphyrin-III C-methyltransferase